MKYLLFLALLFTGLIACSTEAAYEVEEEVEASFKLEYPDATKASWRADKANGYYDVVFNDKGNELTARYDRNGKRVRSENENDDYDRRNIEARTVTTSTARMGNRKVSDYDRETQTKLSSIGFRTDIPMLESEVSLADMTDDIKTAVKKDYQGWTVHKVKQIEQEGRKLMKIELKSEALDKEVKPMYTMDGRLVGIDD